MIKLLIFSLLFISCGKIVETPFSTDVNNINSNKINKEKIESILVPRANYKITVISDTHNHDDDFKDAVKRINQDKDVIFTVLTGDLTNVSLKREFERAYDLLKDLNKPFLITAGNHDLLNSGEKIFKKIFGEANFSVTYGDSKIILFNNNNWESSKSFYFKQKWLEEEIDNTKNNFLFSHVPYDDEDRFNKKTVNDFKNFINNNNIPLVFNGHNHSYNDTKINSFTKITVGSVAKRNYVTAIINNGVITYEKVNY